MLLQTLCCLSFGTSATATDCLSGLEWWWNLKWSGDLQNLQRTKEPIGRKDVIGSYLWIWLRPATCDKVQLIFPSPLQIPPRVISFYALYTKQLGMLGRMGWIKTPGKNILQNNNLSMSVCVAFCLCEYSRLNWPFMHVHLNIYIVLKKMCVFTIQVCLNKSKAAHKVGYE